MENQEDIMGTLVKSQEHVSTDPVFAKVQEHGGQRSIRSIARPLDRVDRFDGFDNF